jgi:hypothetical protein
MCVFANYYGLPTRDLPKFCVLFPFSVQREQLARMKKGMPYHITGVQIDKLNAIGFEWADKSQKRQKRMIHPISPERMMSHAMMFGSQSAAQRSHRYPPLAGMSAPPAPSAMDPLMMSVLGERRASLLAERACFMGAAAHYQEMADGMPEMSVRNQRSIRDMMALDRMVMQDKRRRASAAAAAILQSDPFVDAQMLYGRAGMYR